MAKEEETWEDWEAEGADLIPAQCFFCTKELPSAGEALACARTEHGIDVLAHIRLEGNGVWNN